MDLIHLQTNTGPRWAATGQQLESIQLLSPSFLLEHLLQVPAREQAAYLKGQVTEEQAEGSLLAPVGPYHEVWASGVTFLRSREAREAESATGDVYQRVYEAERPELFFKALGWRVVHPEGAIRIRRDSAWNVPEPELTLVINRKGEISGYCAGNDVSSRSIEGENPLYLPQAKVYNGSCALGPHIRLIESADVLRSLPIGLEIRRGGECVFEGQTSTAQMKRRLEELATYLFRELDFPLGVFLMTGTGIVPPESFTLQAGDEVIVDIGGLILQNQAA